MNRYVLYCDNLTAQTHDSFKSAVSEISGVAWFGLPKATDLWQPVDAGYAQLLKVLMRQQFENWLDDDEHAERWYANEKPFTASERRVLITHWGGNAYKKLCSPQYDDLRLQIFVKTGCLMTSDGSDDHLVKPEGLADYVIPPPSLFIQPASAEPQTIGVEQEEMPADVEEAEPIEPEETDDNLIDEEKDRILNDDLTSLVVRYEHCMVTAGSLAILYILIQSCVSIKLSLMMALLTTSNPAISTMLKL